MGLFYQNWEAKFRFYESGDPHLVPDAVKLLRARSLAGPKVFDIAFHSTERRQSTFSFQQVRRNAWIP